MSAVWSLGVLLVLAQGPVSERPAAVDVPESEGAGAFIVPRAPLPREPLWTQLEGGRRLTAYYLVERCRPKSAAPRCTETAIGYEEGRGVVKDVAIAAALYERLCLQGGVAVACSRLGGLYHDGLGVPRDHSRALELFAEGCARGERRACSNEGRLLLARGRRGADDLQARERLQMACDWGDPVGCNNLAWALERGRGGAVERERALSLYTRACREGLELACENLPFVLAGGGEPELATAARLLARRCAREEVAACGVLGYVQLKRGRAAEALPHLAWACAAGRATSCHNLGWLYDQGEGVERNAATALELYERACRSGVAMACSNAASSLARDPARAPEAEALRRRACALGLGKVCAEERP